MKRNKFSLVFVQSLSQVLASVLQLQVMLLDCVDLIFFGQNLM